MNNRFTSLGWTLNRRCFQTVFALLIWGAGSGRSQEPQFPVTPLLFVDTVFRGCEGIAFNGEGKMFVSGNQGLYRVYPDGRADRIADLSSNLGVTAFGERDVLVADFGPTNAFRQHRNHDGIVWRITPEGQKTELVRGIGDPNFIWVRKDRSLLISDDATNEIFLADSTGRLELFCTAVNHPNGIVLNEDESLMYVAQIFSSIRPVISDNALWSVPLQENKPAGGAVLAVRTGPGAANDGLAIDVQGRIYIAANNEGRIYRFDPRTQQLTLIAEGMFGAASIAFGEGAFDPLSLYVTTTFSQGRGGNIWRIPVGTRGARLNR